MRTDLKKKKRREEKKEKKDSQKFSFEYLNCPKDE